MSEQPETLTDEQVSAHLALIGIACAAPTVSYLHELQLRHLRTVPFENLSIHLGEPISLALPDLFAKIVVNRRGGFCYGLGPPFDHLALSVGTSDDPRRWLVDVGFGRHSAYPLEFGESGEQHDPIGVFRLEVLANGDVDVWRDGRPQYRVEPRPRELSDFGPTCWWQQTRPGSHFRAGPVCSLLTESGGFLTLAGRLLISTEGGERTQTPLGSDEQVLAAYERYFGVRLDRVPVPVEASRG